MEDFKVSIDANEITISDVKKWGKELEMNYESLFEMVSEWDNYQWAVFAYMDFDPFWITDIHEMELKDSYVELSNFNLLVADECEADNIHFDKCSEFIDDYIPGFIRSYFNYESFAEDQNRGDMLAGYDGIEHAYRINNEWIYVYRN